MYHGLVSTFVYRLLVSIRAHVRMFGDMIKPANEMAQLCVCVQSFLFEE